MRQILPLLAAVAATGCVSAPPLPPAPPPPRVVAPAPRAVAPPPADWRDWPVTPGIWRYSQDERGSTASFGTGSAVALLRCDRAGGRVFLSVAGAAPGALTVRTTGISRTLAAGATNGQPAYVAATLAPADPLLDAMSFSRGRIALSLASGAPIVLPAWAEIGRVVEDCRP